MEFTELCKEIKRQKNIEIREVNSSESIFNNSELIYLIISDKLKTFMKSSYMHKQISMNPIYNEESHNMIEDCNNDKNVNCNTLNRLVYSLDDAFLFDKRYNFLNFEKRIGCYSLFVNEYNSCQSINIKKPKTLIGDLKINGNSIQIASAKPQISIDIQSNKYRFSKNKAESRILLDLCLLNFRGRKICKSLEEAWFEIEYERKTTGYETVFCIYNSDKSLKTIEKILTFLEIKPEKFLNTKIELYMAKKLPSMILIEDFAYFVRYYNINCLLIYPLLSYLEKAVVECESDNNCYLLYQSLIFYMRIYRIPLTTKTSLLFSVETLDKKVKYKDNALKLLKQTPKIIFKNFKKLYIDKVAKMGIETDINLQYGPILDVNTFLKLSNNINMSLDRAKKESMLSFYSLILKYKKMDLNFTEGFIKKLATTHSGTPLEFALIYNICEEYSIEVDKSFLDAGFKKLSRLFCSEIKYILKHKLSYQGSFNTLIDNFKVTGDLRPEGLLFQNILLKEITECITEKIVCFKTIEKLYQLYKLIILFEKIFVIKCPCLEAKLKEKAAKLVKS